MRRRGPRLLLLVVLFLAGGYALVYGLFFHRLPFDETKQRQVTVAIPTSGEPGGPPPESPGNAPAAPPAEPPREGGHASEEVDPFRSPPGRQCARCQFGEPLRESAGDAEHPRQYG